MYLLVVAALLFCVNSHAQSIDDIFNKKLTPSELKKDFAMYRQILEETHPGLYRYVSKSKMKHQFDSIYNSFNEAKTAASFYRTLTAINATIKCAHTSVIPRKNIMSYFNNKMKTIPFYIYPVSGKYYVLFNGSTNTSIKPGYQLIKINNHPIDSIAQVLKQHYWTDGNIHITRQKVMEGGFFQLFYYSIIERPNKFNLVFKNFQGRQEVVTVNAQVNAETQKLFKNNSVNKTVFKFYGKNSSKKWDFEIDKEMKNVAHLRIYSFSSKGAVSGETAAEDMRKFMNQVMKKISAKSINYLILDLRGNAGGWDSQGVELFTYLTNVNEPVLYYKRLHSITNNSEFLKYSDIPKEELEQIKKELLREEDGTFTISAEFNNELKLQHPKSNRYTGKLFILIDRNTASAAAEFSAVAKSYNIGVMIGTETGGGFGGGNGGSFINYQLPYSKFSLNSPLVFYENAVRPQESEGRGTLPDYTVDFSLEDLLTKNDVQLEFVKDLIKKEKK